jgi:hypothetical protein
LFSPANPPECGQGENLSSEGFPASGKDNNTKAEKLFLIWYGILHDFDGEYRSLCNTLRKQQTVRDIY